MSTDERIPARAISGPGRFGALADDDPNVGQVCPACKESLKPGDKPSLVVIGPGEDEEELEKAATGRAYNAVAVIAHEACVHGREAG